MAVGKYKVIGRKDVNDKRNANGETALHYAAKKNNVPEIERLLSLGADINFRDQLNRTPLISVAFQTYGKSHFHSLEVLLKNGANVNARDDFNQTVLHHLGYTGSVRMTKLCFEYGPEVNIKDNIKGESALFHAVRGSKPEMVQLFLDHGSNVNAVNADGKTPLHVAAFMSWCNTKPEVVSVLLKNGADATVRDADGKTPLHLAVREASVPVVQLYLDYGADVNVIDRYGNVPLYYVVGNVRVIPLLLKYTSNFEIHNISNFYTFEYDATTVHWASVFCKLELLKLVLKDAHAHLNINALDSRGYTPVVSLLEKNHNNDNFKNYRSKLAFLLKHSDLNVAGSKNLEFCSDERVWRIILEHLAKIQAVGNAVSQSIIETVESNDEYRKYFKKCRDELVVAKGTKVKNTSVTFFNLLVDSKRKLKNYGGNQDLVKSFKETDCLMPFPIYGPAIQKNVKKGINTRRKFNKSAGMLSNNIPIFGPNHLIIRDTLDCLKLKDYNVFVSKV